MLLGTQQQFQWKGCGRTMAMRSKIYLKKKRIKIKIIGLEFAVGFYIYMCVYMYVMMLKVCMKQSHQNHAAASNPLNSWQMANFFFFFPITII